MTELYLATNGPGTVRLTATTGTVTATDSDTAFSASDVGRVITFRTPGGDIRTTIATYVNQYQITVNYTFPEQLYNIYYYLDYANVDLFKDIPFPLTYKIADVRSPDKRDTSSSKTVRIPGSPTNNKTFGHIFDIDIDGAFNPNIKALAYVLVDTVEVFRGIAQLLRVFVLGDKVEYEIALYGTTGGFLFNLTGRELRDLDLTQYNHSLTTTNVIKSWHTSVVKDGVDYDNFTGTVSTAFPNGSPNGEGYTYPFIDNGFPVMNNAAPQLFTRHLPVCVYVKTIIDAMFSAAGYTYTSSFFSGTDDTGLFPQLIAVGNTWKRRVLFNYQFVFENNGASTAVVVMQLRKISALTGVDASVFDVGVPVPTTGQTYPADAPGALEYDVVPGDVFYWVLATNEDVDILSPSYWTATYSDSDTRLTDYGFNAILSFSTNITGGLGGMVIPFDNDSTGLGYDTNNSFDTTTYEHTVGNTNLQAILPDKVKCVDFFMSIVKMFNLYIDRDKDNTTNLIIEPRDTYYEGGTTVDWTNKLDESKDLELIPMGELDFRTLKYSYKEDGDFWNAKYKKDHAQIHGELTETIDNDFVKSDQKNELIFAPTPSVQALGNADVIVPSIIKEDPATVTTPNSWDKPQPRILIYNGKASALPEGIDIYAESDTETPTNADFYPFAGMWNASVDADLSLMFALPKEVYFYYSGDTTAIQDLFYLYHSTYVAEIADKDSKIVIGWFFLDPVDIFQLDFRNLFFIDGHYLRLNKVVEYDPVTSKVTKCEFIKVKKKVPYVPGKPRDPEDPGIKPVVIEGGLDEIRDVGASNFYHVIEGGEDEVRDIGATSTVTVIKG